jgi:anti-sigma factor RsiW
MCDFSGKLIAWMDGELPEREAAPIEEHLEGCAECRSRLASYRQVSDAFVAYCEAASSAAVTRPQRGLPAWALAAMGAAAAAALLLTLAPKRVVQSPAEVENPLAAHASAGGSPAPSAAAPVAERAARHPASVHRSRREPVLVANTVERPAVRVPSKPAALLTSEPAIEIAIPSDAIFPEGAVPEGVSFVADVTLGADGTAERLRLQPRMVEFERRATRP